MEQTCSIPEFVGGMPNLSHTSPKEADGAGNDSTSLEGEMVNVIRAGPLVAEPSPRNRYANPPIPGSACARSLWVSNCLTDFLEEMQRLFYT